jgi:hypothetical protein
VRRNDDVCHHAGMTMYFVMPDLIRHPEDKQDLYSAITLLDFGACSLFPFLGSRLCFQLNELNEPYEPLFLFNYLTAF